MGNRISYITTLIPTHPEAGVRALTLAIKQPSKHDIKQSSELALITHSSASRLSSGLHTAITAM